MEVLQFIFQFSFLCTVDTFPEAALLPTTSRLPSRVYIRLSYLIYLTKAAASPGFRATPYVTAC